MFLRDKNELVITTGGIGKTGEWRLSPTNDKLILKFEGTTYVYQGAFIDDALMALKLSGTDNPKTLFINPAKIPDLNYQKYLNEVEKRANSQLTEAEYDELTEYYKDFVFTENNYDINTKLISGYKWNEKGRDTYDYYENGIFLREYILYEVQALQKSTLNVLISKRKDINNSPSIRGYSLLYKRK